MSHQVITVEHLIDSHLPLSWSESLALAQAVAATAGGSGPAGRLPPGAPLEREFVIDSNGTVSSLADRPASISPFDLAILLEKLLSLDAASDESRAPAGLHFAIGRALGVVEAAPFASLDAFSDSLARFEESDRGRLLRQVFARYTRVAGGDEREDSAVRSSRQRHSTAAPSAPGRAASGRAPYAQSERPAAGRSPVERRVGARPDALRRLIREIDRETFAAQSGPPQRRRQGAKTDDLRRRLREADKEHFELTQAAITQVTRAASRPPVADTGRAASTGPVAVAANPAPRLAPVPPAGALPARPAAMAHGGTGAAPTDLPLRPRDSVRVVPAVAQLQAGPAWRRERVAAGIVVLLIAGGAAVAERQHIGHVVTSLARPLGIRTVPADQPAALGATRGSPASGADLPLVMPLPAKAEAATSRAHGRKTGEAMAADAGTTSTVAGMVGTSGSASYPLEPVPSLPQPTGRLIETVDTGKPVFSSSFAADRSAFFANEKEATGAVVPVTSAGDGYVRVLSIKADRGRNYHPRLSPDGQTIAFDSDRDGVRGVYLASREGRNVRRVSGPEYAAFPAWSPDGSHLAFMKSEPDRPAVWNLWSIDVKSGTSTRLTSYRDGQPWGASWFPDGRRICYAHEDELVILDTASGESHEYASPRGDRYVRMPAVSPDGRKIIFEVDNDGGWLLELADGSMREVLADPSAENFAWSPDGRQVVFHSRRGGDWGSWSIE